MFLFTYFLYLHNLNMETTSQIVITEYTMMGRGVTAAIFQKEVNQWDLTAAWLFYSKDTAEASYE